VRLFSEVFESIFERRERKERERAKKIKKRGAF